MARTARVTEKDTNEKLARARPSVLERAQALGSVSEAGRPTPDRPSAGRGPRARGMDRTSFYEWQRRFRTHGLAGLKSLSRT